MIAAIYARVSTQDQDCALQLSELRGFVARMGWNSVEYTEKASGKSGYVRPELDRLIADAKLRKFDVVLVWKLDRFARSLRDLVNHVQTLDRLDIRFMALTQQIDTDNKNPIGRLMLHVIGAVAEFERTLIMERVRAGQQEYRKAHAEGRVGKSVHSRSGKDLAFGRPARIFDRYEVKRLREQGWSWRKIAAKMKLPLSTIHPDKRRKPKY